MTQPEPTTVPVSAEHHAQVLRRQRDEALDAAAQWEAAAMGLQVLVGSLQGALDAVSTGTKGAPANPQEATP